MTIVTSATIDGLNEHADDAAPAAPGWTPLQRLVVALCALINMLDGMDVLVISFIAPSLTADWGVGMQALGVIFSAGLAGMMIGCVAVAPFADRFGRRPLIILGLVAMTAGMLASGLSNSITTLALSRGLAGIGIGTLLASVAALVSEYAPPNRRTVAVGIFQAGYPLGAVLTGFVSIWALPLFGWRPMLIGAGIFSALLLPVVLWLLPESIGFLEQRQPSGALRKTNALRAKLALPTLAALPPLRGTANKARLGNLFARGMWRPTLLLWTATLLGFAVLYFVTSWIPKLSIVAGLPADQALVAGTVFNIGGLVGSTTIGLLAVRLPIGKLICAYLIAASALFMLFSASLPLLLTLLVAGLIGLALQGGFSGFYSLAALLYPASIRSSGIGWAMGIGRGGAVVGPLAGGYLLDQSYPLWLVFLCFAVPLAISGLLALIVHRPASLD